MDSSNSNSFQSSSGAGDTEEFDSRPQSISSFFNPSNPNLTHHHLHHPPPPPQPSSSSHHNHHHHQPPPTDTTFFNPSPSPFSPNSNPNTNPLQEPGPGTSTWTGTTQPIRRGPDHHLHNIGSVTLKNPKKRTRASRRAPTTVLTTDTTNFRQMVQEFTGIPAFPRRPDLFRPTAQKLHQQPPFLNHAANYYNNNYNNNNITAATSSSGYNLQPSNMHEVQKQPSSLLDLQNSTLSFQSLLQSSVSQQPNHLGGLQSGWRDQGENFDSRSGGDQVEGNQGSWICPSN